MGAEEMEGAGVTHPRRAVFLDRDGTIIEDMDYLTRSEQIRLLPGVPEALRRLREAGYLLIVVTNQSAIARGWLTEDELHAIHADLNELLSGNGAAVDAFYHCPHLPDGDVPGYARACDCRKPEPGLILHGADDWGVDLAASWVVGDSERDIEAGRRAGCRTVRVGAGDRTAADASAPDLAAAVDYILGEHRP